MSSFTESEIEAFSLSELQNIGFEYVPGPSITAENKSAKFTSTAETEMPYGEEKLRATVMLF